MPAERDAWLEQIARAGAERDHCRNLRGKTLARCERCDGRGYTEPSRTDSDAHGTYYVPAVNCWACNFTGRVEVPCSPEVEAVAIQLEIEKLKARMRELKRKMRQRKDVSAAGAEE